MKDIITEIDGNKISAESPLSSIISKHKIGDAIELKIWRETNETTLKATLAESPAEQ